MSYCFIARYDTFGLVGQLNLWSEDSVMTEVINAYASHMTYLGQGLCQINGLESQSSPLKNFHPEE